MKILEIRKTSPTVNAKVMAGCRLLEAPSTLIVIAQVPSKVWDIMGIQSASSWFFSTFPFHPQAFIFKKPKRIWDCNCIVWRLNQRTWSMICSTMSLWNERMWKKFDLVETHLCSDFKSVKGWLCNCWVWSWPHSSCCCRSENFWIIFKSIGPNMNLYNTSGIPRSPMMSCCDSWFLHVSCHVPSA